MNDRELLEAAAKAAGIENAMLLNEDDGAGWYCKIGKGKYWRPLTDDGDALRLAVKLGIDLRPREFGSDAACLPEGITVRQLGEPEESARRAIVLVAAEIGGLLTLPPVGARRIESSVQNKSDPEQSIWMAAGFALDTIGVHDSVNVRRKQVPQLESDHDYRKRIIARIRGETQSGYSDWADE